jgi:hypothetical protein
MWLPTNYGNLLIDSYSTGSFFITVRDNKCINSKNKAKGFWEMLRDNKTNVTLQIIDPVDKTTIISVKTNRFARFQ